MSDNDEENVVSPKSTTRATGEQTWTQQEMEDAEPYPLPQVSEEDLRRYAERRLQEDVEAADSDEPGQRDEGGLPSEGAVAQAGDGVDVLGYGYPAPFTRFEVPCPYTQYPFVTVGKIFFRQNGGSYVGSAASIGNYAIFTAGHCVHAGDGKATGWSTDLVFVPAYRDGQAPRGRWSASYLVTRSKWYSEGNPGGLTEDMGGAVLRPLNGRRISQAVGYLGFAWNWSREQHWLQLGYPAAKPFNGQRMHGVASSYAYNGSVPGVPPVAVGSDLTGGCSGGPWLRGAFTGNSLNGINSYRQGSRPQEINSPYFDDRAKSIKDTLVAGNP